MVWCMSGPELSIACRDEDSFYQGVVVTVILINLWFVFFCRERVVHILGARPHQYDSPNVMLRLKNEGLNPSIDSTKHELDRILEAVGTTNSKGCWSLKPQYLGELNPNWNFYSDTDKQLVSR